MLLDYVGGCAAVAWAGLHHEIGLGEVTIVLSMLVTTSQVVRHRPLRPGAPADGDGPSRRRRARAGLRAVPQRSLAPARPQACPSGRSASSRCRSATPAARRAGALEFLEALPLGWDTVLSREYAGGADLSGGQWQRVALARALFAIRHGARVLVLDEPTAWLDVRAEAGFFVRFLEITAGAATIAPRRN